MRQFAISRDGRHLISIGMDGVVLLWDWPNRRVLGKDRVNARIINVSFPTDSPVAVAVVDVGWPSLRFWSAAHGKRVEQLAPGELAELPGGAAGLDLITRDVQDQLNRINALPVPDAETKILENYQFRERVVLQGGFTSRPDGTRNDYWVRFRSLDNGGESSPKTGSPSYFPQSLAYNPTRQLAAYGDQLGQIIVWDVATGLKRLMKRGRSVYTAAFTREGKAVVFGHTPDTDKDRWADNHYGTPEWTFDLEGLQVRPGATGDGPAALLHLGPARPPAPRTRQGPEPAPALREILSDSLSYSRDNQPGSAGLYPRALYGGYIWSYTFLESKHLGFADPIAVGTHLGELFCLDPKAWLERRSFLGHTSVVTDVGETPDGKMLVSGSMDGTVRLWSLENVERKAFPDFAFDFYSSMVTFVPPGGPSARFGIRPGDVWKTMDGRDWREVADDFLNKKWDYRVGQTARLVFTRDAQDRSMDLPLVAYGDVVDPLVSLYVAPDGEWVAWTPEGYYAASMRGDRLIGWRANCGRGESAAYYEAQQLGSLMHKPEILREVIKTGKRVRAIDPKLMNLNNPKDFRRAEPPHVEIEDLPDETTQGRLTLRVRLSGNVDGHEVVAYVVDQDGYSRLFLPQDTMRRGEIEIELSEGRNEVVAVAESLNSPEGFSPSETIVLRSAQPMARQLPKAYVLAVGIGKFKDKEREPLEFAEKDAREFLEVWKGPALSQNCQPYATRRMRR